MYQENKLNVREAYEPLVMHEMEVELQGILCQSQRAAFTMGESRRHVVDDIF